MQNLKINSTSTPYWCVVVPVDAEDLHIYKTAPALEFEMYGIEYGICLPVGNYSILGCITSSGMDEGVREVCYLLPYKTFQDAALWILQYNQITFTDSQKAVVIKQIT